MEMAEGEVFYNRKEPEYLTHLFIGDGSVERSSFSFYVALLFMTEGRARNGYASVGIQWYTRLIGDKQRRTKERRNGRVRRW